GPNEPIEPFEPIEPKSLRTANRVSGLFSGSTATHFPSVRGRARLKRARPLEISSLASPSATDRDLHRLTRNSRIASLPRCAADGACVRHVSTAPLDGQRSFGAGGAAHQQERVGKIVDRCLEAELQLA